MAGNIDTAIREIERLRVQAELARWHTPPDQYGEGGLTHEEAHTIHEASLTAADAMARGCKDAREAILGIDANEMTNEQINIALACLDAHVAVPHTVYTASRKGDDNA